MVRFQGEAQGTYYAITYYDSEGRDFQMEVDSILHAFDNIASLWVEGSVISRINANDTTVVIPGEIEEMFLLSQEVSEASDGAFDITVGPLVNAWGFGFRSGSMPDSAAVDSMMAYVGFHRVRLEGDRLVKEDPRIAIDLNAVAQGYSVDVVGRWLEGQGIEVYLVDIGGEVLARGAKPDGGEWKVGIEKPSGHPDDPRELEAVALIRDKALATSGSYRKFYEKDGLRFSHTIDPRTGYPVSHHLLSASVLAGDAATADAWATAFMVMGTEAAMAKVSATPALEAFLIYTNEEGNFETWASPGLKEMLVTPEPK